MDGHHILDSYLRCRYLIMWEKESVLVLGTPSKHLMPLLREARDEQALISFYFNATVEQVYTLPIEQYSMALLCLSNEHVGGDTYDVGRLLRRSDQTMRIVLASEHFPLSSTPSIQRYAFADVLLALPSSAAHLAKFF